MIKKMIGLVVIITLLVSMPISVHAAIDESFFQEIDKQTVVEWYQNQPQTRSSMSVMELSLGKQDGKLRIYYITLSAYNCSEIGIKNLTLQRKVWWGWETMRITNPVSYNTDSCIGGYYYLKPQPGEIYRLQGTHYCVINGIEYEQLHTSGTYTFS